MNKKYKNRFLRRGLILGIFLLFIPYTMVSQCQKIVQVTFEIEGEEANFANGVELSFFLGKQEIKPLLLINGFFVPDFGNAEKVDVCFRYKRKVYRIDGLSINKFETDWTFGIDRKPFKKEEYRPISENAKMIYYISFNNRDGGVGTEVMVEITRKK